MNHNNSAHRLCAILEKAVAIENPEQDTTAVIGRAMGIEDISDRCFMTNFFALIAEVEQSVLLLKNVPKKTEYIKNIRHFQTMLFSHNLRTDHWSSIKNLITNGNLILILDACANFIALEFKQANLSEQELADYLSKCEDLLSEIATSELADDLKTFLIVRLEEVCSAIRNYSIGGSERLQKVVEANIGGMILKSAGISAEDREKPILKKLFNVFLTFGSLLGIYTDSQSLLQSGALTQLFLPPSK